MSRLAEKVARDIEELNIPQLVSVRLATSDALAELIRAGEVLYEFCDENNLPCADDWSRHLSRLAAALGVEAKP